MTDFEKIKNYYKHFDEKNRLQSDNSGKLEFLMEKCFNFEFLKKYIVEKYIIFTTIFQMI